MRRTKRDLVEDVNGGEGVLENGRERMCCMSQVQSDTRLFLWR